MRNIVLINLLLVLIISPLFGFAQTIDSIKSTTLKGSYDWSIPLREVLLKRNPPQGLITL